VELKPTKWFSIIIKNSVVFLLHYLVAFPFIAPGITMKRRFSENDFMAYLPFRYEIYRCKEKKTQINLRKMVLVNLCKRFLRLKLKFVLSIKTRPHKHTCTCHITHINTCIHVVSGDSRSEKYQEDHFYGGGVIQTKETDDLCDEFLLVEGSSTIWTKLSAKKRRKLLGMRLGKVTTF